MVQMLLNDFMNSKKWNNGKKNHPTALETKSRTMIARNFQEPVWKVFK